MLSVSDSPPPLYKDGFSNVSSSELKMSSGRRNVFENLPKSSWDHTLDKVDLEEGEALLMMFAAGS